MKKQSNAFVFDTKPIQCYIDALEKYEHKPSDDKDKPNTSWFHIMRKYQLKPYKMKLSKA